MIKIEPNVIIESLTKQIAECSIKIAERDAAIQVLQSELEELRQQQLQEMNE